MGVNMVMTQSRSPSSTTFAVAALSHLTSFMAELHLEHSLTMSFTGVTLALQVQQHLYSSMEMMTSILPSMVVKSNCCSHITILLHSAKVFHLCECGVWSS